MDRITESQEFQDFLIKNSIDTTDYRLEVVSPNSTDNNLIMLTDGTNKWYYRVSNEPARHYALRDTLIILHYIIVAVVQSIILVLAC
jgi:hypothetical protein